MSNPRDELVSNNVFGKWRSFLGDEIDQEDIKKAIGTGANGRTRIEITDQLREYFRLAPKA